MTETDRPARFECIKTWSGLKNIKSATVSADGRQLRVHSGYSTWNFETGELIARRTINLTPSSPGTPFYRYMFDGEAMSPNGQFVAITEITQSLCDDDYHYSEDNYTAIRVWDISVGELLHHLNIGRINLSPCQFDAPFVFSPDSHFLIGTVAAKDKLEKQFGFEPFHRVEAKIWNAKTGEVLGTLNDLQDIPPYDPQSPHQKQMGFWWKNLSNLSKAKVATFFTAYAISFDNLTAATGNRSGVIKLWTLPAGQAFAQLSGHSQPLRDLAFSPDGQTLVSVDDENTLKVWNLSKRKFWNLSTRKLRPGFSEDLKSPFAISPDSRILAARTEDNTIALWNLTTGELLQTLSRHSKIITLVFSTDSESLVAEVVEGDRTLVKVWQSGANPSSVAGDEITSIGWDSVRGRIQSENVEDRISAVREARFYWQNGTNLIKSAFEDESESVRQAAAVALEQQLGIEAVEQLWQQLSIVEDTSIAVDSAQSIANIEQKIATLSEALANHPNGLEIALEALADRTYQVRWAAYQLLQERSEPEARQALQEYNSHANCSNLGVEELHTFAYRSPDITTQFQVDVPGLLKCVAIDPNYRVAAYEFSYETCNAYEDFTNHAIQLRDLRTGELQHSLGVNIRGYSPRYVLFSPNGDSIAAVSNNPNKSNRGMVQVWQVATGELLFDTCAVDGDSGSNVNFVAFSPTYTTLVTAESDRTLKLRNARTGGEVLRIYRGHQKSVDFVAFSPNGQLFASHEDESVKLWKITGEIQAILSGNFLAFSPDGLMVASYENDAHRIKLWSITGELLAILAGHSDRVTTVAFDLDGDLLASGSRDGTIRLWDWRTGEFLGTLEANLPIDRIAFRSDAPALASWNDKGYELWNLQTGEKLLEIEQNNLSVSSEGRVFAVYYDLDSQPMRSYW